MWKRKKAGAVGVGHGRCKPLVIVSIHIMNGGRPQVKDDVLDLLAAASVVIASRQGEQPASQPNDAEIEAVTGMQVCSLCELLSPLSVCFFESFSRLFSPEVNSSAESLEK